MKTLKDMLKLHRSDIKSNHRMKLLTDLTLYSMSLLLRDGQYKDRISKSSNQSKTVANLFLIQKFRADFCHTLSR